MKKRVLTILASLLTTHTVMAAQNIDIGKYGVGLALTGASSTVIKAPIDLKVEDLAVRVEPQFGYSYVETSASKTSAMNFGSGVYLQKELAEKTSLYYGGKLIIGAGNAGFTLDSSFSNELAGVIGGEYYIAEKFSVGAEASIGLGFGKDRAGLATNSQTIVRFYY